MAKLEGTWLKDRYRVDELIGRGGMAEVYKVWDTRRAAYLALKFLREDMAQDPIFLRRFRREAQTLAKLQHPGIVRFYGLEQDDIHAFMLMDFVEGESLRTEIFRNRKEKMSFERILQVMQVVCSALHYAHQEGMVHCDLKPGNIMVEDTGRVLVTDFGIARMTDAATATMVGAGTPAYMAPEQIRGKDPTPQTDIYALGIVLFEMLTGGERPFTGERASTTGSTGDKVRWEQLNLQPPSPREWNPAVSPQLEAVVMKCLEKEPAGRYQTALDLMNALELAVGARAEPFAAESEEVPTPKPVEPEKQPAPAADGVKEKPRRKMPSWGWLGIWVIVIGAVIGGLVLGNGGSQPQNVAILNTSTATETIEPTTTMEPTVTETQESTQLPVSTSTPTTVVPLPSATPESILGVGSSIINSKDSAVMMYVPAGEFIMGSSDEAMYGDGWSRPELQIEDVEPAHVVYTDAYWIYKYEVTNRQYRLCMDAGGCTQPRDATTNDLSSIRISRTEYDGYPVGFVDWSQAEAYCSWAGGKLPTEAEWEKAARGTDERDYPWGDDQFACGLANYYSCEPDILPVGSFPSGASPYGVLDMLGNAEEWVMDWYSETLDPDSPSINPMGPESGEYRILRGGTWLSMSHFDRNTYIRRAFSPNSTSLYKGFRCAMNIEDASSNIGETSTTTSENDLKINSSDGASLVVIPAGEFEMGADEVQGYDACMIDLSDSNICRNVYPEEAPVHMVYLDEYYIYQTEVTNDQFAAFLTESGNQVEGGVYWYEKTDPFARIFEKDGLWQTADGYADHEVNAVSWFGADSYCEWAGGRLPTEAEWEKAARGTDGRVFPWGIEKDCAYAPFKGCVWDTQSVESYSLGASPYGVLGMIGFYFEWVNDWYDADYYKISPYENPLGPSTGEWKIKKGSGPYRAARPAARYPHLPNYQAASFRCVVEP